MAFPSNPTLRSIIAISERSSTKRFTSWRPLSTYTISRPRKKTVSFTLSPRSTKIGDHDYQTKLRNARGFIERGDKVKLTVFFRGREIVYVDKGNQLIARFVQDLSDIAIIERNVGLEGKMIQVYLMKITSVPKKKETETGSGTTAAPAKTE